MSDFRFLQTNRLILENFKEMDNRITKLEKLMEDINDKLWMNYDSGVPSEDVTDEILESVREMTEKKTMRDLLSESYRLLRKLREEETRVQTVLDEIKSTISVINFYPMANAILNTKESEKVADVLQTILDQIETDISTIASYRFSKTAFKSVKELDELTDNFEQILKKISETYKNV